MMTLDHLILRFLEKKIYTMPQFLEQRFDKRVSLVLSFFWLAVYIFILSLIHI